MKGIGTLKTFGKLLIGGLFVINIPL